MGGADENLRHGGATIGALDHLAAPLRIAAHVDLRELDPPVGEKRLGGVAKAAKAGGINFDLCHRCAYRQIQHLEAFGPSLVETVYMGGRAAATTRAKVSTLTSAAPPRRSARAQASTVAPVVITSSTRIRRRPATAALPDGLTRKAPCTLRARADWERPTCWGVAFARLSAPRASGTCDALAIASASSADWLKRRAQYRRQCSGTGMMASASSVSEWPAVAIQRPIIGARSRRSPYLSACTSVPATSSKRTAARAWRYAGGSAIASIARTPGPGSYANGMPSRSQ